MSFKLRSNKLLFVLSNEYLTIDFFILICYCSIKDSQRSVSHVTQLAYPYIQSNRAIELVLQSNQISVDLEVYLVFLIFVNISTKKC